MAGSVNIWNGDPKEIFLGLFEKAFGVKYQRQYVDVSWTSSATNLPSQHVLVTLSPKVVDGFCPYVEPWSWAIAKVNPTSADYVPQNMSYSGSWPITFDTLRSFFNASYGLTLRSGEWEFVYGNEGTRDVYLVDEVFQFEESISADRYFVLRPSANHPILATTVSLKVFITKLSTGASVLTVSVDGATDLGAGEELDLLYSVEGGVPPYAIAVTQGTAPAPLDPTAFRMKGTMMRLGSFNFTVGVSDKIGTPKEIETTVTVAMDEMLIEGNAPDTTTGQTYDHQYIIEGGMLPYRLVRIINLPATMKLDDSARLTGWAETGTHAIAAVYEDALGHRSRIVDEIVVQPRSDSLALSKTWSDQVDWVELGGGRYPNLTHYAGASWSLSASTYSVKEGLRAAGLSVQNGFLSRDIVEPNRLHYGVALWVKRGLLSTGGGLVSNFDGVSGLEVRIDDISDQRLRINYWKDSQPYSLLTPEDVPVLSEEMGLVTIQVGGGHLTVHRNEELIAHLDVPSGMVVSSQALTVGRPPNLIAGYQWNGVVSRIMTFKERVYSDQLKLLVNNGRGLEYIETLPLIDTMGQELHFNDTTVTCELGQETNHTVSITGASRLGRPVLFSGGLPPGMVVDFNDTDNFSVMGTPTQTGIFVSRWAVETDKETATLELTFKVV